MKLTIFLLSAMFVSANAQFNLGSFLSRMMGGGSSGGSASTNSRPAFCKGLQCPRYRTLETNDMYELRQYEPSTWVATTAEGRSRSMFMTLFSYIQGSNAEGAKISMTAPVATKIEPSQRPNGPSTYTMHFMLTFDRQANPPAPTDPNVFIVNVPQKVFYVKSFGGWANEYKNEQMHQQLVSELRAAGKFFEDTVYYTAGYDSPYTFFNRHNEIWVEAK